MTDFTEKKSSHSEGYKLKLVLTMMPIQQDTQAEMVTRHSATF